MKDSSYNKSRRKSFKSASKGGDSQAVVVSDKSEFAHIQPVQALPLEVKVYNNNFDKALKAFRALVQKERILSIYKDKQTHEKTSDKKRRKRNEMKRKLIELENPRSSNESKKVYKTRKSNSEGY